MTTTLIWITGASSGIGAAMAASVPFEDAELVDVSRSGSPHADAHVAADLADPSGWEAAAADFAARLARFDGERAILVHCAGTVEPTGFAGEVDAAAYRTNVLINSAAPQVLGDAFLRAVRDSGFAGRADVVMLTSGAARKPYAGWTSYSAGKAAVDAWVHAAGQEQDARGGRVRVLSVAPGVVATAMQETIRATPAEQFPSVQRFVDLHASGELREPVDVAADIWAVMDEGLDNGAVVDVRRR